MSKKIHSGTLLVTTGMCLFLLRVRKQSVGNVLFRCLLKHLSKPAPSQPCSSYKLTLHSVSAFFFCRCWFVVSAITCPWELSFVLWLAHVCLWSRLHSPLVSPPHPFLLAFCFVNPSLSVQGASGLDGRPGPPVSVISPIPYVPVPWCCGLSPLSCHNHICITVFPTTEQNRIEEGKWCSTIV